MLIWDHGLRDLFEKGGLMMWPLLMCSVFTLALILERLGHHLLQRLNAPVFVRDLRALLDKGQRDKAMVLARSHRHAVARLALVYLAHENDSDAERGRLLEREGVLALAASRKHVDDLAVLSKIATLLGLLGTVTGLASTFHQLEGVRGAVNVAVLASGIWEALITTVFGLCIAIPAMAFCHHFQTRVETMARWMGLVVSHLDSALHHTTPSSSLQGAPPVET